MAKERENKDKSSAIPATVNPVNPVEDTTATAATTAVAATPVAEPITLLISDAINVDLATIAPTEQFGPRLISKDHQSQIVDKLSKMFGISEIEAVTAIFILFLKGAANANAPLTMSATVHHTEGGGLRETEVDKYNLLSVYSIVTKDKHLRRLAETLAAEIGSFAEKNRLSGDLAKKVDQSLMTLMKMLEFHLLQEKELIAALSLKTCLV